MRKVVAIDVECPRQALLIMHSDGLKSHWSLDAYPGLLAQHPALVASVLYRDFCRGNDDVTVLAVRFSSGDEDLTWPNDVKADGSFG